MNDEQRQKQIYEQLSAEDYSPWRDEDFGQPHLDEPRINAGGASESSVISDVMELFT